MKIALFNKTGEKKDGLAVPETLLVKVSSKTLALYVNYLRSNSRFAIADTKGRGEVSGGGKKPWKQKGTGNARVGSTRSPLWVGGGVTFGPTSERNFSKRMNRQERRKAILGVLSDKIKEEKLVVVEDLDFAKPTTREAVALLEKIGAQGKVAVILTINDENAWMSLRNIEGVRVMIAENLDTIYLMDADKIIATQTAFDTIQTRYSGKTADSSPVSSLRRQGSLSDQDSRSRATAGNDKEEGMNGDDAAVTVEESNE